MRNRCVLVLLILSLFLAAASADILVPGEKRVRFSFHLKNTEKYSKDYVFIAYPVNTSWGAPYVECRVINSQEGIHTGKYLDPVIYAIKKESFNAVELDEIVKKQGFDYKNAERYLMDLGPVAKATVTPIRYLSTRDRRDKIEHVYAVSSTKGKLTIRLAQMINTDRWGTKEVIDYPEEGTQQKKQSAMAPHYFFQAQPLLALLVILAIISVRRISRKKSVSNA